VTGTITIIPGAALTLTGSETVYVAVTEPSGALGLAPREESVLAAPEPRVGQAARNCPSRTSGVVSARFGPPTRTLIRGFCGLASMMTRPSGW
jgi:hypothetical protein